MKNVYQALYSNFVWSVPPSFNIAEVCCRRWAKRTPQATAIFAEDAAGKRRAYSFAELQALANRISGVLRSAGVKRGDRVALVLPQRFETAAAHMAVYQLGAVAMPLSQLFGPDALEYRLQDSGAVLAICDAATLTTVAAVRATCPHLRAVLDVDSPSFAAALGEAGCAFTPVKTKAEDAAVLIYTSGTTGPPKGALIAHRALIGNLSGFVCSQNWYPQEGDVFWSPADWAWTGGLMDALLPALYFGRPIVGFNGRFSPQTAFELMERYAVTNTFLFPTALKAMMKAYPAPHEQFKLRLRAIMSAGEAVGDAVFEYCETALGVTVNEMFGQTEINYIVGNCAARWPARAGSMGRAYPGHRVAVIDELGHVCKVGESGDIAVHRFDIHGHADPVFFLGYWKNQAATAAKYTGQWCRTGDVAYQDADGYLWYQGRSDDVFKSSGYRIGPSEIENCLVKHPAVLNAAVVPKPDAEKGNLVKAVVVLSAGFKASPDLVGQLQAHVRSQLAAFEVPKEIVFVDSLPMTTTGKVQRRLLREG